MPKFAAQCEGKQQHPKWMHDFAQEDSKNPYTFHVVYQMQSTIDIHVFYFQKEAAEQADLPIPIQNSDRVG